MATATTPNVRLSSLPPAAGQAGLRGAVASEFTKLRSVRSTYWTLGALFIVSVGLSVLITAGTAANMSNNPGNKAGFDATQTSLGAFFEIGQLIIAVLGAMVITSEYSTGMIRTSLTAQPRRGVVYAAKAIVFTTVTLVISLVTAFVAFFAGQAMYAGSAVGTALFVTIVALIAFGVGSIVRHTAGTITIVVALMFIIPLLENTLPSNWHNDVMRFLPDAANQVVSLTIAGNGPGHLWSAWPQLGVTALWAAVLVAVGAYLFRK